jgi:rhamnulokinase
VAFYAGSHNFDHKVLLNMAPGNGSASAAYVYFNLSPTITCTATLSLTESHAKDHLYVYEDVSTTLGCHGGTVRLLKNLVGLWIVQECRREWARQGQEFDYVTLMSLAAAAPAFISLLNPDDPRFLAPGDMPQKVAAFCRETKQSAPTTPGATVRCVLESLALAYRGTFEQLKELVGHALSCLHIVGGGSQSALLNQFTANALGIPVLAGPVEATAVGNVLVQAIALGHLPSLESARELVRNSFPVTRFEPGGQSGWNEAWKRFPKGK